jgi:hypothetical protein
MIDIPAFIGTKVGVTKTKHSMMIGGKEIIIPRYVLDENEPTIARICSSHPSVRVWLPDTMGTADVRPSRLNVYINEAKDGDFFITGISYG